jgi:uncharacterized protein
MDRILEILITFFVRAKFYSLFSLLFGWGMAMQMSRAKHRGSKFIPVYLRRLLVLLIFGILHGALIWSGDILTMYALLGFLLLLFRNRSQKLVLAAAGLMLLLAIVTTIPGPTMDTVRDWCGAIPGCLHTDTNLPESLYGSGTFAEIARLRYQDYSHGFWWVPCYLGNVFAMFLLGLYVGKRRIFRQVEQHLSLLRWVTWLGLAIGVLFSGASVYFLIRTELIPAEYRRLVLVGTRTIGAPALMLFYVSGIILLQRKDSWHRRLAPLGFVGRSALSNYLMQSILGTLIFYNYGLGLYGEVSALFAFILSVVIFASQIRLSRWWFESHQYGPAERLWRALTYGRLWPALPGETEPVSRWQRLRQSAASVPRTAWLGIGLVLIIALGTLGVYYVNYSRDIDSSVVAVEVENDATIEAAGSARQSSSQEETDAIATPQVHPVEFRPGLIANSGDLVALASTFKAESAYAQIETLIGPPYKGRSTGSTQGWAVGEYLAEQFANYGLQPAGDEGSFFQHFPFTSVSLEHVPKLLIQGPDGTLYRDFSPHEDFSVLVQLY